MPISPMIREFATFSPYLFPICNHPVVQEIKKKWKVIVMDCATALAVAAFVIAFFKSSLLVTFGFGFLAGTSIIGSFYMRRFNNLQSLEQNLQTLEQSVVGLQKSENRFRVLAKDYKIQNQHLAQTSDALKKTQVELQAENNKLHQTSQALKNTQLALECENKKLHQTSQALKRTQLAMQLENKKLQQTNQQLAEQTSRLTLQVTQLTECGQRIQQEVRLLTTNNVQFGENNEVFRRNLALLDKELFISQNLSTRIASDLGSHGKQLNEQVNELKGYLAELRAENGVKEKIEQLGVLQDQMKERHLELNNLRNEFHNIQLQYREESARFEAVHQALVQLRQEWERGIQSAIQDFSSQNQNLKDTTQKLNAKVEKLPQEIINNLNQMLLVTEKRNLSALGKSTN